MFCWAPGLLALIIATVFGCLGAGCTAASSSGNFAELLAAHQASERPRFGIDEGQLSLSHLQFKGSHNSYHRAPRLPLSPTWRYTHAPLDVQLTTQGVRQLELDVRYTDGELRIAHLPVIDGRSTCKTFHDCLTQLKRWSRGHAGHLPVFVFVEPKENVSPSKLDGRVEMLDAAISRVFARDNLLLPGHVAGGEKSVADAVRKRGWPSVEATRNKIAFVLFGTLRHRAGYVRARPRLADRMMFAADEPGQSDSGIISVDDPLLDPARIERAVREGFLVRTRADADLVRNPRRRDAALSSGAHFVSSDFVDPRYGWLELGDLAPVRCNPLSAPRSCRGANLAEIESVLWAGLTSPLTKPLAGRYQSPPNTATDAPLGTQLGSDSDVPLGSTESIAQ